ncbi:MAG TPA: 6,7-dimethyl-8-ribityllumazine synthase [Bdellovibrionota bacterium]|jgi:6,7-dimethyl-8-ribityllumazine synthase|nr:6,7-dimethyl-8-ribityllumazine synthase [Bdellovibrionota bacterium]
MRFAILVSRYNEEVTSGLLSGAKEYLAEKSVTPDVMDAPGAFELPLLAREIAKTGRYAGVICLGCVVKGDTAHFEYISETCAHGLMQAGLETGVPVAFGVLTTYTWEQALARSRPDAVNKGREAAAACFESAALLKRVRG